MQIVWQIVQQQLREPVAVSQLQRMLLVSHVVAFCTEILLLCVALQSASITELWHSHWNILVSTC
jgi:hypothetical protein